MFASVGADGSVRMFDLRHLEHSTIIYEDPQHHPLLRLCWNKQDPNYLATMAMDGMEVRTPLEAHRGPATRLWSCLVDPGERFSAGGRFSPRGFLDPPGDVLDCPNFGGGGRVQERVVLLVSGSWGPEMLLAAHAVVPRTTPRYTQHGVSPPQCQ